MSPENFFDAYERIFRGQHSVDLALAAVVLGKASSRPQAALEPMIGTGRYLGLIECADGELSLTAQGKEALPRGSRRAAVRRAFRMADCLAGDVYRRIERCGPILDHRTLADVLRLQSGTSSSGRFGRCLARWLMYAGLAHDEGSGSLLLAQPAHPSALPGPDTQLSEAKLYHDLCASEGTSATCAEWPLRIDEVLKELERWRTDVARSNDHRMRVLVGRALSKFGFACQWVSGPREVGGLTGLDFGNEGDDLLALDVGASADGAAVAWALAAELKRGRADKKAVGQAVLFGRRVTKAFASFTTALACPVVIADATRYAEKSARDYGRDAGVILMPISAIAQLLTAQQARFASAERLIASWNVFHGLWSLIEDENYEPSEDEVLHAVCRSLGA